jgi:hypothetical protein
LIEKFFTQLINKEVGKFVFERDPPTFAAALALAQTKTAIDVTFKTASRANIHAFVNPSAAMADNGDNYSGRGRGCGHGTRGRSGNGRSERREGETGKCWICDSSSHQKSACQVWDKALTLARKESGGSSSSNRRTGGSGGAGRERANYRGRSTSGRRPSHNALSTTARPVQKLLLRCLRVQTLGLILKTRQAGFGPAGRRDSCCGGDTCHLSPCSQPRPESAVKPS